MIKKTTIAALMIIAVLSACKAGGNNVTADGQSPGKETDADVSYAFGLLMGSQIKSSGISIKYGELLKGLQDNLEGNDPRFDEEEANNKINVAYAAIMEALAEENKTKGEDFLEQNKRKNGVVTTESGLQYEVIVQGTGEKPAVTDTVEVNYEGTLLDGTVFDSSYERGEPAVFPLNRVITGWIEGIQLMSVGSTYNLYIPSELGYGNMQAGEQIQPNSTLIFKVELLSILE
jgi:FKBP-type peptidyl-prolyl cis-trans isomerase